jgi:DNA-binding MarR family transcriptional regulator
MTDDLDLTDALVQLSFLVQAALAEAGSAHDLSVTQVRLLGILRDHEPLMLELARALGLEKSSVTGLVDRAAGRGLVERFGAAHDGRAVRVRLTAAGRATAAEGEARIADRIAALAAPLAARDRTELIRLAARIIAAVPQP